MAVLLVITTSRRNLRSIWSSVSEVVCKFSSRLWLVRPSLSMSSHLTPLRMLKQRFRTKKESPQTSSVLSLQASNSKTVVLLAIITSRRSQHFTWSSVSEVVCKFSSRPWLVRPSLSMSSHLTPLRMLKQRFRTKKESPQTSSVLSLQVSNLKTVAHWAIITSRRSQHFTWSSASEVACKFSSRPWLVRRSPSMSSHLIRLRMLRQKSRIRRESLQTSNASSLQGNNSKTAELWAIITSRRNQHFIWFFACVVDSDWKWSRKLLVLIQINNLNKVIDKKSF